MKRIIGLLLCMMLLLASLTTPAAASEIKNYNVIFTIDSKTQIIVSAVSTGEYVYVLLTDNAHHKAAIGRWSANANQTEILLSDKLIYRGNSWPYEELDIGEAADQIVISRLFTDGNAIYAYSDFSRDVRRLIDAEGNAAVSDVLYSLDANLLEDQYIRQLFIQEDLLYLSATMMNGIQLIARLDPMSGELLSAQEEDHIDSVYPYRDGKLLALTFDPQNRYDQETGMEYPYELMIYTPSPAKRRRWAIWWAR